MEEGTSKSRALALALACGALVGGGWQVRGSDAPQPQTAEAPPGPQSGATTGSAQAAALKGLDWFVANKDAMTPDFAIKNAEKFRRVTADEGVRRRMDALIQEKLREIPAQSPELDPGNSKTGTWFALQKPVQDLLFQKALGRPWKAGATALAQLFAERGEAILPPPGMLSQRLVAARQLRQLGLPADEAYRKTLAAIRAQPPSSWQPVGTASAMAVYARTHVVFTLSDYYSRYLDPAEFGHEIAWFGRALEEYAGREELDNVTADVASEVLAARKVLRLPPDARANAIRQRLLAMQNADGSWGGEAQSAAKVHHTAMAILALMEFAPEFRVGMDLL